MWVFQGRGTNLNLNFNFLVRLPLESPQSSIIGDMKAIGVVTFLWLFFSLKRRRLIMPTERFERDFPKGEGEKNKKK